MRAMVLHSSRSLLVEETLDIPDPSPDQVLVRIAACAVCRTDLHVIDDELPNPKLPLIPGHEIIGEVVAIGSAVEDLTPGVRVGIPWLAWTCGVCSFCKSGNENLCERARFTGYTVDGGYAEYTVADHRYCMRIPETFSSVQAAPLLCAGLIGYRSYTKAGAGRRIGLYGFGAAAHILCQIASHEGREVFAFTRTGDLEGQQFARSLGAVWAGSSDESPPELLDAAILFAPVGALVPVALKAVRKGGRVICGGIHMSDVPSFPYELLWGERSISSVANLTRGDGARFMDVAKRVPLKIVTEEFPLSAANEALERLRKGRVEGAAVLIGS